jgi:hypothetical protein
MTRLSAQPPGGFFNPRIDRSAESAHRALSGPQATGRASPYCWLCLKAPAQCRGFFLAGAPKRAPRRSGAGWTVLDFLQGRTSLSRRNMMMRKTSLILLGAAAGVAVTLIATQPRIVLDGARAQAAAADTYGHVGNLGGNWASNRRRPCSDRSCCPLNLRCHTANRK